MGQTGQDVTYEWNNVPRRVTVSSFYMDETEVSNHNYREYLYWVQRVFGESYPEVYLNALPDTLVWREELSYNEPLVETYFRQGKGEYFRYEIEEVQFESDQNWQLVYSHQGTDDDRPARLRHTLKRSGDSLTSSKEVRFIDGDDEYVLRNGTELRLQQ